ncbi:MFS transporter, partial [Microbacterium sp. gxy059]|uniref:MFS transporter n=1 Tax=Microbacterium sp. gxy059 TaxID=2957199 RepID=UPI003D98C47C
EAALGLGIAAGPLIGGLLGHISWRGPFFGVAVLMGIALVATLLFIPKTPKPVEKISLGAPLKALKHRGLLTMGIMALLYNWGFFTMLGYAPYPMKLDALQLGFVFTGWGLLVAAFAVFFAPRLQRRFGTAAVLYANLAGLGIVMTAIAFGVEHPTVVIVAVIVSGAFIGINNTLTTQAVMLVSPVERSVASSAYGFLRFFGGGLAPFVAGIVAAHHGQGWAFGLGAIAFFIAIPVLASGHRLLAAAERSEAEGDAEEGQAPLALIGEETPSGVRPVVAAIDATAQAADVVERAGRLAAAGGTSVELVHVVETDVVADVALEPESDDEARRVLASHLSALEERGIPARGILLASIGDHGEVGEAIARHAEDVDARTIVLGRSENGPFARFFDADLVERIEQAEARDLVVVP